ncbi:serine/threonine-protein kinase BLUS1-like [Lactuca sativa]|uniref:serine/threonine-protein kinase BLUS1-like n=1 Tax=Lactuca sativa TaxID=4236 RepID=UPI0022AF7ABA|nr:serine/threonine-protein kinase BLUS1-like [Lactuca sativa]
MASVSARCIVLAITPANSDLANSDALTMEGIANPDGGQSEDPLLDEIQKEEILSPTPTPSHHQAGNILIDTNGVIKLGGFGWADIWLFGITALELAHGHASFSKYPPMKVLLMTIQNAPPRLDYDQDKRFSSFKELVAMCLVKGQIKRPTAEKLLKHSFFKQAKAPELPVKKLFGDLPPLWHCLKDVAQLALKKMPSVEQETISVSEYQRGVSAWNFDLEDLKFKAFLVQDDDEIQDIRNHDVNSTSFANNEASNSKATTIGKDSTSDIESSDEVVPSESLINKESNLPETDDKGKSIVCLKSHHVLKKPVMLIPTQDVMLIPTQEAARSGIKTIAVHTSASFSDSFDK